MSADTLCRSFMALVLAALLAPACLAQPLASPQEQASGTAGANQGEDMVRNLGRALELTDEQRRTVDPIVRDHAQKIDAIRRDSSITGREKRARVREETDALRQDLKPLITPRQARLLDAYLTPKSLIPTSYQVSASYEIFLPSDPQARSIFGNSPSSFGAGLHIYEPEISRGTRIGLAADLFSLISGGNTEYVLAPQISVVHYIPLMESGTRLWAYGRLAAGPAYIDYSFDTPLGEHFGAKRLGADASAEVGLRYGEVELAANYRLLTAPAGINTSGWQLSLTWFVFHFHL